MSNETCICKRKVWCEDAKEFVEQPGYLLVIEGKDVAFYDTANEAVAAYFSRRQAKEIERYISISLKRPNGMVDRTARVTIPGEVKWPDDWSVRVEHDER